MATSSFNTNHTWSYDVFMSFGRDNIIKRFVDHLFTDFKRKGIRAFKEDEDLQRGEERSPQIQRAIEQSRFLVVIFSESLASSPSCLRELRKILECKEKDQDKYQICPIFYSVKPQKVVNGPNSYVEALKELDILEKTEVTQLKEALTKAANLPGWDLEDLANGYESKFIDMISRHIFNELNVGCLHIGEKLVGIHSRTEQMNLLQYAGSSEVHMIGICGLQGIGKTSIAKAVYNRLYAHFDDCVFCENVKDNVKKHGMIQLQRQIIEDITKSERKIRSVSEGSSVMIQIMKSKRVLLILDDGDQLEYLEALAGSHSWFGPGSLVVVTGEDRQLLCAHGVEKIHEVEPLHNDEALELFSLYAFNQKHSKEDFKELSEQVIEYVNGHPLAIKVLGCFLFGKTVHEWESELKRLKSNPVDDIQVLISRFSLSRKSRHV
ncbi:putative TIR domain, P-loop containing nucleoside triphosphate hydrolase [Helianthus annuus]|nr:putative TIR domain, P-loop containing nucleoside triphosphate hydrolase [Helianthus annuus]